MIDESLALLRGRLAHVGARSYEHVLFGSTVLYLHGIETGRPVGDVDVFVSRRVWGLVFAESVDAEILTPRADDPPIILLPAEPPVHVFYAWTDRDREWMDVDRCFQIAETVRPRPGVGPFRCIPLEEVRRHKALAGSNGRDDGTRAKHEIDLKKIDERLAS